MDTLIDSARAACAANPGARAVRFEYDGKAVWAKRAGTPRKSLAQNLHAKLSPLLPPLLRAAGAGKADDALAAEALRLRLFRDRGISVPEVLAEAPGLLVLSDVGLQLQVHLTRLKDAAERDAVLRQAATELARLHRAGLAHGRPFTKDMAWKDGTISFIDFEQDPAFVMPLDEAQARDAWLFLNGAVRFTGEDKGRLENIFFAYKAEARPETLAAMKRMVCILHPLCRAIRPFLKIAGKDAFRAVTATAVMENGL